MVNTKNSTEKKYVKYGIVAAIVVAIAVLGIFVIRGIGTKHVDADQAVSEVSSSAASGADLRIAVVRMDAIQTQSKVLQDLRKQKESYENKLRDELTKQQTELEKEKADIEKSHDVLSQEALQRRVVEYQSKVTKLQRDLTERAQAVDVSFQKALGQIQEKHLDPIIEAIIDKKNLSLVIDCRFARTGKDVANLDITTDVINALDKKVASVKMEKPKGF